MSLEIKINDDIKQAMLAKDKRKLEALRAIKAALIAGENRQRCKRWRNSGKC